MSTPAILALQDGTVFHGTSIGADGQTIGEVVFNTAMTGYQEILTDPSYCRQIVTLTYPHIGNTGTNSEDMESSRIHASGLIIRDSSMLTSSWRAERSLTDFLKQGGCVAIADIDTRKLTRIIREKGAQSGCIMTGEQKVETAVEHARKFPGIAGTDLAKFVTTQEAYQWSHGTTFGRSPRIMSRRISPHHVVAYDFGVKRNILRLLSDLDCRLTVVPAETSAEEAFGYSPDGIFLSNGPGDPEPCEYAIDAIREFLAKGIPVFGICLGHQLLALAAGARTEKMKFGHHGANHPVQDLASGRVMITSQNHGFAVAEDSLPDNVRTTHRSLFDGTLQGIAFEDRPAFGFQGHPEASPGPHDLLPLFERFIQSMEAQKKAGLKAILSR
ncbi:MAG: glutamine-hydrolyzing carbamoyl-phosphate synthase small subunit [Gammaproteobacteria bacterium]|nr:glutamine-hydrolyzing carbamoyl-phosphate synthase small subunit [Gammaproteobacteria bacterium]MBT8106159.1 glutamine-hydrolyzing carbamoyl-phosphate synthase small subunit [Gammaproteobacteria bacterium]NNF48587.1 glutamine-hydrolyzing carbamoyl-phosphate synthase small subunit [Woeseiaceae bacterium]NNK26173.1 glutamine-hydrolyzing carbamoyl-phosphate synthase small subunit [Woeseiaceae bacterium]NNL63459.1 glutamine-hydrolyzing carbamoyl-phosphate synthase small subunit [Woeseiaceae bact